MAVTMLGPRVCGGLLGLLVAWQTAPARAGDGCAAGIRSERLRGAWLRAVIAVERTLAGRDDIDRCVELVVTPEAGGVRIVARRSDGETAVRHVESPADVGPTALALMLVPPVPLVLPVPPEPAGSPPMPVVP